MMCVLRNCLQLHYANSYLKCCISPVTLSVHLRNLATVKKVGPDKKLKMNTSLPHQPVPPLDETLNKYLQSVRPFLNVEEYENTKKLVEEFRKDGQKLQSYLQQKAQKEENWLSEWWLNTAYLEFRKPVVMWSSPGLVFPRQTFNSVADQLTYAANMVSAAIDYKEDIYNGNIKQDMSGKDPLDMAQYYKIFGTCRIPRPKRDALSYEDPMKPLKHIVVAHNNNFFKLNIYCENGGRLTVDELYDNLLEIVESSLEKGPPVGILTSENRNTWSECYNLLTQNETNKKALNEIQKSLFLLCLDNLCEIPNVNEQTKAGLQTVHGGGSHCNSANRWFDKTVQFIVNRNGEVGLTYEHSPAEGQPLAIMMDFICDQLTNQMQLVDLGTTRNYVPNYEKLQFSLTDQVEQYIKNAERNMDSLVRDLDMACFTYTPYGKNFIKAQKFSPDSFIQMALQYAFYRLHKVPGAQYETASTRKFLHGRTETIRSCSVESISFAEQMLNTSASRNVKIEALQNAITSHKDYTVQAMNGLGVDRHLLGLKLAALELGVSVPKLYSDVSYTRSTHMRVSTSQVASKCDGFMCYGPLVEDGYACCYNPRADNINFGTAALNSSPETNVVSFKDSLELSLDEIKSLFE